MNMNFKRKLPIPFDIRRKYPIDDEIKEVKNNFDNEIKIILSGRSNKFLLIIGPCSSDNIIAVKEYMKLLKEIQDEVSDKLLIVPRLYSNKPRSKGDGYMGLLHQPDHLKSPDLLAGLEAIRKLNIDIIKENGFVCADELLYPENYRYFYDVLGYCSIGTRSVEDQIHRLVASGIESPVGMKNPPSGDYSVMFNAIHTAQTPHTFIYRGWEVESKGNIYAHAILRGYIDNLGNHISNYSYEDLLMINELYNSYDLQNKAIIVDCNHSNSGKDYLKQIDIALDVINSRNKNNDIKKIVKGLMIESYLLDGNQDEDSCTYGLSITDGCLGIEKTKDLIKEIHKII